MSRRSIDDDIYGDRSSVRKHRSAHADAEITDFFGAAYSATTASKGFGGRCYETHPPLPLPGEGGWQIFGGSCFSPIVTDADVYIGFDSGMKLTPRSWPWKKGTEFLFEIRDMTAPSNPAEFKKLIAWTIKQLEVGAKIHAGCIGGHGRTGTFLAALVAEMGEKDAVSYVRKNYCHRAVESGSQIDFLVQHFGVTAVKGHKEHRGSKGKSSGKTSGKAGGEVIDLKSQMMRIAALPGKNHDRIW